MQNKLIYRYLSADYTPPAFSTPEFVAQLKECAISEGHRAAQDAVVERLGEKMEKVGRRTMVEKMYWKNVTVISIM